MAVRRRAGCAATRRLSSLRGKLWLIAAILAALVPTLAHAAGYNFSGVVNPADPTFNQALGINDSGVISGYYGSGADAAHPNKGYTLVPPSSFTSVNFPGSVQSQVVAINNAGDTAGFYVDAGGNTHGFVNVGGTFRTIDNPGGTFNQLLGLNSLGTAAGYYQNSINTQVAYTVTNLTSAPKFTAVPDLPSNTGAQATGVNNAGIIVGFYVASGSGNTYGYIVNPNTNAFTSLLFPGSTSTQALGENNIGVVVGDYVDSGGKTHGFIYSDGSFATVDDPLGVGSTVVNGINDLGELAGFYVDGNNNTVGFGATEIPEPGSFALFALSGLLGALRWLGVRKRG
jgi:hypothetical protein